MTVTELVAENAELRCELERLKKNSLNLEGLDHDERNILINLAVKWLNFKNILAERNRLASSQAERQL